MICNTSCSSHLEGERQGLRAELVQVGHGLRRCQGKEPGPHLATPWTLTSKELIISCGSQVQAKALAAALSLKA